MENILQWQNVIIPLCAMTTKVTSASFFPTLYVLKIFRTGWCTSHIDRQCQPIQNWPTLQWTTTETTTNKKNTSSQTYKLQSQTWRVYTLSVSAKTTLSGITAHSLSTTTIKDSHTLSNKSCFPFWIHVVFSSSKVESICLAQKAMLGLQVLFQNKANRVRGSVFWCNLLCYVNNLLQNEYTLRHCPIFWWNIYFQVFPPPWISFVISVLGWTG